MYHRWWTCSFINFISRSSCVLSTGSCMVVSTSVSVCKKNVCVCVQVCGQMCWELLYVFAQLCLYYIQTICVCAGMWLGVFHHILQKSSFVPLILSSSKHHIGQRYVEKQRETVWGGRRSSSELRPWCFAFPGCPFLDFHLAKTIKFGLNWKKIVSYDLICSAICVVLWCTGLTPHV